MLSIPDMALLGAAALMFFGPEQLPKVARKAGMLIRDVQNTSQSFIREMERAGDTTAGHDVSRAHLLDDPPPSYPTYEPPSVHPYMPQTEYPYGNTPVDAPVHEAAAGLPEHVPVSERAPAPYERPIDPAVESHFPPAL